MKKFIALSMMMLVLLSSLVLAGCDNGKAPSPDSPYIGTWKATKGVFKEEEFPLEEILTDSNGVYILDLKDDGTAVVTTDAEETGTWTETSKGVKLEVGEDNSGEFKADGDTLYVEFLGVRIVFEKQ